MKQPITYKFKMGARDELEGIELWQDNRFIIVPLQEWARIKEKIDNATLPRIGGGVMTPSAVVDNQIHEIMADWKDSVTHGT